MEFLRKLSLTLEFLITKLQITPCKTKVVKGNSKEQFDSIFSEEMNNRDKLFLKFKKSRLHLDQGNCKKAHYEVKKLIAPKNRKYFETKLTKNIDIPKQLWKTLKWSRLSNRIYIATTNALKNDKLSPFQKFLIISFLII